MKNTIKTFAAIIIASFALMGGCVQKLIKVDFDYTSSGDFATQAITTTGTNTFGSSVVTSELKQKVEDKGASLNDLDELKLISANVAFKAPKSSDNFDGIENIEVWISASGLSTIKLASKVAVPDGLTSIPLDVNTTENLAGYLKATTLTYEVKGSNSAPLPAMDLKITATYNVKASKK